MAKVQMKEAPWVAGIRGAGESVSAAVGPVLQALQLRNNQKNTEKAGDLRERELEYREQLLEDEARLRGEERQKVDAFKSYLQDFASAVGPPEPKGLPPEMVAQLGQIQAGISDPEKKAQALVQWREGVAQHLEAEQRNALTLMMGRDMTAPVARPFQDLYVGQLQDLMARLDAGESTAMVGRDLMALRKDISSRTADMQRRQAVAGAWEQSIAGLPLSEEQKGTLSVHTDLYARGWTDQKSFEKAVGDILSGGSSAKKAKEPTRAEAYQAAQSSLVKDYADWSEKTQEERDELLNQRLAALGFDKYVTQKPAAEQPAGKGRAHRRDIGGEVMDAKYKDVDGTVPWDQAVKGKEPPELIAEIVASLKARKRGPVKLDTLPQWVIDEIVKAKGQGMQMTDDGTSTVLPAQVPGRKKPGEM